MTTGKERYHAASTQAMKKERERVSCSAFDSWYKRFCNKIDWLEHCIIEKTDSRYFNPKAQERYSFSSVMFDNFIKAVNERMNVFAEHIKSAYSFSDTPFSGSETAKKHIND